MNANHWAVKTALKNPNNSALAKCGLLDGSKKKGLAQRLAAPTPERFKRVSGYGLGDALSPVPSRFNPLLRSMSVT
jgi:hypothetical protein